MHLIEAINKLEYNNFVAAHESGSFLQSWEWGDWQSVLGREVLRYFITENNNNNDNNKILASLQLIKMPLPFGKYYLYVPYGPVISEKYKVESGKLLHELNKEFHNALFIRIEPKTLSTFNFQLSTLQKSPNIQPAKTLVINLSQTEDQLLSQMHHKARYNIKVAQKHGVEIKDEFDISIGHGLFFEEALRLIIETSKRQKFNTFPSSYYKNLVDRFALKNQGDVKLHIYKAIYKNQLLSAAIIMDFGDTRTFLFGGSSDEHKNVMAPYLMHWQAMQDAKKSGMKYYDFWGIETASGETPGFVRFKLGFGGVEKEYAGAYDIVKNKAFYKAYGLLRKINKTIKKISK